MALRGMVLAGMATAAFFLSLPTLAADVGQSEKVAIEPSAGRVGTRFDVTCIDFPEPGERDVVLIVAAGTPDFDPDTAQGRQIKVLWRDYAANCYRNNGAFFSKAGPFAPGAYEVRYLTTLYNNDKRLEVSTRTPFTVR